MADKRDNEKNNVSSNCLMLTVTIVNRKKAEFYADLIQSLGANMQMVVMGEGTADEKMYKLGLADSDKAVIMSVMTEAKENEALRVIEEKFRTIRNGKGVAVTIPFTSVIGASVFNFLADNRMLIGR